MPPRHLAPPESLTRLAKRIWALERKVHVLSTQPQLGTSGFSGTIIEYDENGNIVSQVGLQDDGTHGAVTLDGPTPPTPSAPILTPIERGLLVEWDGTFTNALVAPLDFSRVSVYVSETSGFTPTTAEMRASVESPQGGGSLVLPLDIVPQYVRFICWSTPGKPSAVSEQSVATPESPPVPWKNDFLVTLPWKRIYRLSKLPIDQSVNLSLNGLELLEGDEYVVDLDTADITLDASVVTVAGSDADMLTVDYWTYGVDAEPPPPDALFAYEFSDTSSSLPADWSWIRQSASGSYAEAGGVGTITDSAGDGGNPNWNAIGVLPGGIAAGDYTVIAKLASGTTGISVGLRDSVGHKALLLTVNGTASSRSGWPHIETGGTYPDFGPIGGPTATTAWAYAKIVRHDLGAGNNTYDLYVSEDGSTWTTVIATWTPPSGYGSFTPDQLWFGIDKESAGAGAATVDSVAIYSGVI